jgi:hypothetical protein
MFDPGTCAGTPVIPDRSRKRNNTWLFKYLIVFSDETNRVFYSVWKRLSLFAMQELNISKLPPIK